MAEAGIDVTDTTTTETPKLGSIIPAEFKDKPYLKDLVDLEVGEAGYGALFKKLNGAQELIGKKIGVPAADAPDEEHEKYYASLRPETVDAYELGEKIDPEFGKVLREGFHKMGATPRQAKMFQDTVLGPILEKEAANKAEQEKLDAEFTKITTEAFGAENEKVMARANAALKELTPDPLKPFVGALPNESLAVLSGIVNAILDKYGVEDDFGAAGGASGGGEGDPEQLRRDGEKLMASDAWNNPMHADHSKTVEKVNALFKQAGEKESAARSSRRT